MGAADRLADGTILHALVREVAPGTLMEAELGGRHRRPRVGGMPVDAVLVRRLAKAPAERGADAAALVERLQDLLAVGRKA